MGRFVKFIMIAIGIASLSAGVAGCQQEGVIPARDMSALFAAFYTADAMVDEIMERHSDNRMNFDSIRMYRPSLEALGYTDEDFRTSLNYYLHRPQTMEKILDKAWKQLDEEAKLHETGPQKVLEGVEPAIEQEAAPDTASRIEQKTPQRQLRKKMTRKELKQLEKELK